MLISTTVLRGHHSANPTDEDRPFEEEVNEPIDGDGDLFLGYRTERFVIKRGELGPELVGAIVHKAAKQVMCRKNAE